jgi:hypothetical protein
VQLLPQGCTTFQQELAEGESVELYVASVEPRAALRFDGVPVTAGEQVVLPGTLTARLACKVLGFIYPLRPAIGQGAEAL